MEVWHEKTIYFFTIFKMKRNLSMSFRRTHFLGNKHMLDIRNPESDNPDSRENPPFLQNIPLILISVRVR